MKRDLGRRLAVPGSPWKGVHAMRIGRRVAKVLIWGLVLCLSILGGGLWFAYTYVTDSEKRRGGSGSTPCVTCRARSSIRRRVRVAPLIGELTLNDTRINQQIDGSRCSRRCASPG